METLDPRSFLLSIHPFDRLEADRLKQVVDALDIHYYQAGDRILARGVTPEHYFVIAKGVVEQSGSEAERTVFGPKDSFDALGVIRPPLRYDYTALEETILFALPAKRFLALVKESEAFESYYLEDISKRVDALLSRDAHHELSGFMLTRIKESYFRPLAIVTPETSIHKAVEKMSQTSATAVLVDFDGQYGVVSDSDLRRRVILERRSYDEPIGPLATRPVLTVESEDFLWSALLLMTERNIKRLVVVQEGQPAGMIEQMDLLSAMSHKSHLMQIQIQKAASIDEVQKAAQMIEHLIRSLQSQGVKVRHITALLGRLNAQIYRKLWELIAPKEIIDNSCLIVMGSEGRREQTLRTDQDNALIVRDGFDHPDLENSAKRLNDALVACGFPLCDGGVMARESFWRKPKAAFKAQIAACTDAPDAEKLMQLAILYDGRAVAGDESLLNGVKLNLIEQFNDNATLLSNFARGTLAFETPLSLFANFVTAKDDHAGEMELKKGGLFAIVQGVRSLSVERGIKETGTFERIELLASAGVLEQEMASDLIEAFDFLLTLRLGSQLEKLSRRQRPDNYINPAKLSKIERDILRDSFKIVDRFKKLIGYHFKLGLVG